jgi:hypothetical protein
MTVGLGAAKERKEHERIWDWNYGRRRAYLGRVIALR